MGCDTWFFRRNPCDDLPDTLGDITQDNTISAIKLIPEAGMRKIVVPDTKTTPLLLLRALEKQRVQQSLHPSRQQHRNSYSFSRRLPRPAIEAMLDMFNPVWIAWRASPPFIPLNDSGIIINLDSMGRSECSKSTRKVCRPSFRRENRR